MLPIASEGNVTTAHGLGRKGRAPQSIGMRGQNPSLRPNEMSELLTAPEWRMGCSSSHRREMSQPLTASGGNGMPAEHRNEMSEPLTASQ
jgi:hypothetical protein